MAFALSLFQHDSIYSRDTGFSINSFLDSRTASLKDDATFHSEPEDSVGSSLNWDNPTINDHLVAPSDSISSGVTFPFIPDQTSTHLNLKSGSYDSLLPNIRDPETLNPAALLLPSLPSISSYQDSGQATPVLSTSNQDSPDPSLSIAVPQPSPIPLDRPRYLKCQLCSQKFASGSRLRSVVVSKSPISQLTDTRKHSSCHKSFTCQIGDCDSRSFTLEKDLLRHQTSVHKMGFQLACPHCGKQVYWKDHLVRHLKTHENSKKGKKKWGTRDRSTPGS